ncbi:hypothetical protein [Vineibacter terrae]|uniref:hypothetical protein n=1 Tax=Vineibacter terrae TaxID=2586908 RepID=UPI002E307E5C|nr:hypothetical protein [Vineibacter terrae]HEX2885617.1 hypothetical protein [Vineibacter terrae]
MTQRSRKEAQARRALACLVALACLLGSAAAALAQPGPDRILAIVIRGLQTGQVNQAWFGPQLLQVIYQQTNGTFVYTKLVELGPVQNIQVMGQQPVPQGMIYNMRAFHANGATDWQMGISQAYNRIEYLAINVVGNAPPQQPLPPSRPPLAPAPPPSPSTEPTLKPLPVPQPHHPQPPDEPMAPAPPPSAPPVAVPPMPTPSQPPPRGGTGGSDACRLYPNLC